MQTSNFKYCIRKRGISSFLCYVIIFGITLLILSSCSASRGIRLRNKSIKKWEKSQTVESEQLLKSKESVTNLRKTKSLTQKANKIEEHE
ncbi:MAG: hypothetical protein AAFP82_01635 [Bacteroidota bacterium]